MDGAYFLLKDWSSANPNHNIHHEKLLSKLDLDIICPIRIKNCDNNEFVEFVLDHSLLKFEDLHEAKLVRISHPGANGIDKVIDLPYNDMDNPHLIEKTIFDPKMIVNEDLGTFLKLEEYPLDGLTEDYSKASPSNDKVYRKFLELGKCGSFISTDKSQTYKFYLSKNWRGNLLENFTGSKAYCNIDEEKVCVNLKLVPKNHPYKELFLVEIDIDDKPTGKFFPMKRIMSFSNANVISSELIKSFESSLTPTADVACREIKNYAIETAHRFKKRSIYCPVGSISQSSMTGKSRSTIELLNSLPGALFVFRDKTHHGYPNETFYSTKLIHYVLGAEYLDDGLFCSVEDMKNRKKELKKDAAESDEDVEHKEDFTGAKCTVGQHAVGRMLLFIEAFILTILNEYGHKLLSLSDPLTKDLVNLILSEMKTEMVHNSADLWIKIKNNLKELENFHSQNRIFHVVLEIYRISNSFFRAHGPQLICLLTESKLPANLKPKIIEASKFFDVKDVFVLILDEVHLLSDHSHSFNGTDLYHVFRRAMHCLNTKSKLCALTISTSSNVADLHPKVSDNSMRFALPTEIVQPYVLLGNFDILINPGRKSHGKFSMTRDLITNVNMGKYIFSLGRPGWSSLPFSDVISSALAKIKNGSDKTDPEPYISCFLIRVPGTVYPWTSLAKSLIKSYMGTLFSIVNNGEKLVVYFPSEPPLALGARQLCSTNRKDCFEKLRQEISHHSINKGHISEQVFGFIVLLAIDDCEPVSNLLHDTVKPDQPCRLLEEVFSTDNFILEKNWRDLKTLQTQEATVTTEQKKVFKDQKGALFKDEIVPVSGISEDDGIREAETSYEKAPNSDVVEYKAEEFGYHLVTVESYLRKQFEACKDVEKLIRQIPEKLLGGLMNCSHFVKTERHFPLFKEKIAEIPSASIRRPNCNIIDEAILDECLKRQCGLMLPDGYFGLDFIVPVLMYCDVDGRLRSVLTFIGFQSKAATSSESISEIVGKCALQDHYVACPQHPHTKNHTCPVDCKSRVSDEYLKTVYDNHLVIVMSHQAKRKFNPEFCVNKFRFQEDLRYSCFAQAHGRCLNPLDLLGIVLDSTDVSLAAISSHVISLVKKILPDADHTCIERAYISFINGVETNSPIPQKRKLESESEDESECVIVSRLPKYFIEIFLVKLFIDFHGLVASEGVNAVALSLEAKFIQVAQATFIWCNYLRENPKDPENRHYPRDLLSKLVEIIGDNSISILNCIESRGLDLFTFLDSSTVKQNNETKSIATPGTIEAAKELARLEFYTEISEINGEARFKVLNNSVLNFPLYDAGVRARRNLSSLNDKQ